jgi:Family of unknown function (DUF6600)
MLKTIGAMKTRLLQSCKVALALCATTFVAGCNSRTTAESQNSTNTQPQEVSAVPANESATNLSSASGPEMMPVPPSGPTLPPDIKPSPPLAEIIRLTRAGVDADVLLAFVNASQSAFNLGSDEIIYLADLGVPDAVVTAMIERDQTLKAPPAAPSDVAVAAADYVNSPAASYPEQPVAVAPSYVNPPEESYVEQPPQQVVNYNYFYNNLSPYGSWYNLDGYGWCWQPTVVVANRNWQPYCDRGRWLYTDCGWYWQSDYSWGMTFQYGRWFNHPSRGWCWWPDRTWGPAWVTWRYNNSYCGWAPLPPRTYYQSGIGLTYVNGSVGVSFSFGLSSSCYAFVPWQGFCNSQPSRYCVSGAQANTVYNNTTVINNFVRGDNNTIVNRGIGPDRVSHYARTPVRRIPLREAESRSIASRSSESLAGQVKLREARWTSADSGRSQGQTPIAGNRRTGGTRNAGLEQFASAGPAAQSQPLTTVGGPRADRRTTGSSVDRTGGASRPVGVAVRDRSPASLIVNGSEASRPNRASVERSAPAGSLIVVGDGNENRPRAQVSERSETRLQTRDSVPTRQSTQPIVAPTAPSSSLTVIGRGSAAQPRTQAGSAPSPTRSPYLVYQNGVRTPTPNSQQAVTRPTTAPVRTPSPTYNRSTLAPSQARRTPAPQAAANVGNQTVNRASASVVVNRPAPAAARPSAAPVPQRSAPQQSYRAPAPQPALGVVRSQPAPSARAQSSSGSSSTPSRGASGSGTRR